MLIYGSETWAMKKSHENRMVIIERKVLSKIMGALNINDSWVHRFNSELYKLYREPYVINFIKFNGMKFAGHLYRLNFDSSTSRIFRSKPIGTRARGWPKLRWIDCVDKDFGIFKGKELEVHTSNLRSKW